MNQLGTESLTDVLLNKSFSFRACIREKKKELAHLYKTGQYGKAADGYGTLLAITADPVEGANIARDLAQSLYMLKDYETALVVGAVRLHF